jgi:hypothetical protein
VINRRKFLKIVGIGLINPTILAKSIPIESLPFLPESVALEASRILFANSIIEGLKRKSFFENFIGKGSEFPIQIIEKL